MTVRPASGVAGTARSDVLMTLAVVLDKATDIHLDAIIARSEEMARDFAFCETLVLGHLDREAAESLVARLVYAVPHARVVRVDRSLSYDQMAMIAYHEAIGDGVVVASADELDVVPVGRMLHALSDGDHLIRAKRRRSSFSERLATRLIQTVTGLSTDIRYLRTMGVSRALLGDFLAQPDLLSFFRFVSTRLEPNFRTLELDVPPLRPGLRTLVERLGTVSRLLMLAAPRLLRIMAVSSFLLAMLSAAWVVYVLLVLMLKADVAEGWASLSLVIGGGLFVQTATAAVFCLGLARITDDRDSRSPFRIIGEVSRSDLFRDFSQLNVERAEGSGD